MENLISALKLFIPILFTPIINRFVSTFRIRQLYLAFENVNPCTLPNTHGFVACLHIYNKGKDKESKVEITIPNATACEIISCNYPGASTSNSRISIDRVLPKQIITLTVYFNSPTPIAASRKPHIKSEDCNGKAFSGKQNIPPSLGPAALATSIVLAIITSFLLTTYTKTNIFYPYYALRYNDMIEQGITPERFSDNELISQASLDSPSPIQLSPPKINGAKVTLPLKIKNVTKQVIKITILSNLKDENYIAERDQAAMESKNWNQRIAAMEKIDTKYGFHKDDNPIITDILIPPGDETSIEIARTIIPTTTLKNFNFRIFVDKGSYQDNSFSDFYEFDIANSKYLDKIKQLLESSTLQ